MVQARFAIWIIAFLGYSVHYMLFINFNMAIVAMVNRTSERNSPHAFECYNYTSKSYDDHNSIFRVIDNANGKKYSWNEHEQNTILGGAYWFNGISHVVGGYAAHHFGAKKIFGLGHFLGSILTFTIPTAASIHYKLVLIIRVVQGFIVGSTFPAVNVLASNWIPSNERGRFLTCYLGVSIGVAITYSLCGYIIHYFNWQGVFYVTGILGIIWSAAWAYIVYDTPEIHPRICKNELEYIRSKLISRSTAVKPPVPWSSILTSVPVMMNFVAQFGVLWGYLLLIMHGPSYLSFIHGCDSKTTGLISGVPNIARVIFSIFFAILTDYLITKQIVKTDTIRRISVLICNTFVGLFLIGIAYFRCNYIMVVLMMSGAVIFHGAAITGTIAGIVDMSPNFSAILQGMCGIISSLPGFLAPMLVGHLTLHNQTVSQWQKVFYISSAIVMVTGLLFTFFGDSNVQKWDSPEEPKKEEKIQE